jgi:hypothetical protein
MLSCPLIKTSISIIIEKLILTAIYVNHIKKNEAKLTSFNDIITDLIK